MSGRTVAWSTILFPLSKSYGTATATLYLIFLPTFNLLGTNGGQQTGVYSNSSMMHIQLGSWPEGPFRGPTDKVRSKQLC